MNANNYGRLNAGAMFSMLNGWANPTGTGAPLTSSGGKQVFAEIRNPVIITETTMYGDQLRILKSADIMFPAGTTPQYMGNSEASLRTGAQASSGFLDLDGTYKFNNDFIVKGLLSSTRGVGKTLLDQTVTYARYGTGTSYSLNGPNGVPDVKYYGVGANAPILNADGSGYKLVGRGIGSYETVDQEKSLALNAEYQQANGVLSSVEFGFRHADHKRDLYRYAPTWASSTPAAPDAALAVAYPSNFGSGLGTLGSDYTSFYFPRDVLDPFMQTQFKATTPEFERRVAGELDIRERQTSLYVMQNLEGASNSWSGNVGLRFVRTHVNANIVTPILTTVCPKIEPGKPATPCAAFPDAINTAGDGSSYSAGGVWSPTSGSVYYKVPTDRSFNHVLPSMNLRLELQDKLIGRLGISKTVGRQNYNIYGQSFSGQTCTVSGCTVLGPNPSLEPMTSNNLDLSPWHGTLPVAQWPLSAYSLLPSRATP